MPPAWSWPSSRLADPQSARRRPASIATCFSACASGSPLARISALRAGAPRPSTSLASHTARTSSSGRSRLEVARTVSWPRSVAVRDCSSCSSCSAAWSTSCTARSSSMFSSASASSTSVSASADQAGRGDSVAPASGAPASISLRQREPSNSPTRRAHSGWL
ncbi:hypothetical protein [Methylibium sp. T29]|uniref:hypothetical protein n=1 Tax=Methylibium sp. T29 TaxID=1430884 RepID=UPI00056601C0|nr:hypothetical protein [Methylibium sp. T29]